jgi:hypothetical protein
VVRICLSVSVCVWVDLCVCLCRFCVSAAPHSPTDVLATAGRDGAVMLFDVRVASGRHVSPVLRKERAHVSPYTHQGKRRRSAAPVPHCSVTSLAFVDTNTFATGGSTDGCVCDRSSQRLWRARMRVRVVEASGCGKCERDRFSWLSLRETAVAVVVVVCSCVKLWDVRRCDGEALTLLNSTCKNVSGRYHGVRSIAVSERGGRIAVGYTSGRFVHRSRALIFRATPLRPTRAMALVFVLRSIDVFNVHTPGIVRSSLSCGQPASFNGAYLSLPLLLTLSPSPHSHCRSYSHSLVLTITVTLTWCLQ